MQTVGLPPKQSSNVFRKRKWIVGLSESPERETGKRKKQRGPRRPSKRFDGPSSPTDPIKKKQNKAKQNAFLSFPAVCLCDGQHTIYSQSIHPLSLSLEYEYY
jgi:hypothetical protein